MVFPVSRLDQRKGSRALVPPAPKLIFEIVTAKEPARRRVAAGSDETFSVIAGQSAPVSIGCVSAARRQGAASPPMDVSILRSEQSPNLMQRRRSLHDLSRGHAATQRY